MTWMSSVIEASGRGVVAGAGRLSSTGVVISEG